MGLGGCSGWGVGLLSREFWMGSVRVSDGLERASERVLL